MGGVGREAGLVGEEEEEEEGGGGGGGRRRTHLGHASVDNEVRAVDEAAFVAGEEEYGVGLFDGFPEASWVEV